VQLVGVEKRFHTAWVIRDPSLPADPDAKSAMARKLT
jgi:hypothetical protein